MVVIVDGQPEQGGDEDDPYGSDENGADEKRKTKPAGISTLMAIFAVMRMID
ncbi:hypothetical protein ACFSQT_38240 [Mesorhizobium calcicola]|uniref:Uncharacterized protein n=1 Tax=Mesorhizobium calcicola TaxID=1300310 RepID=A0ABW4WQE3_9HYPH